MAKRFPAKARDEFVSLVCEGATFDQAAGVIGVSPSQAGAWWRQCGRMEIPMHPGPKGGLVDPPPPLTPREGGSRRPLTGGDRAVIEVCRRQEMSYQAIGDLLGRDRSVIWRECDRNKAPDGVYRAEVADRVAAVGRKRPKKFKLIENATLCTQIELWMNDGWSPGLIAAVLAADARLAHTERVSHETIYQALYVQTRGNLRADLNRCLSLKRSSRKPRSRTEKRGKPYRDAFTISDRPAEVEDRAVPGHWEGDLIVGPHSRSAIGTLVERSTRFTILLHLPECHDAETVAAAMIEEMKHLPEHLRRSITWDRGSELAEYRDIQMALETKLYFCDPHSPWQRGTNENTNRLLRFWFAKSTDLSVHTPEDLRRVAATLNKRPRPTLDLDTPAMRLQALLNRAAA